LTDQQIQCFNLP